MNVNLEQFVAANLFKVTRITSVVLFFAAAIAAASGDSRELCPITVPALLMNERASWLSAP